MRCTKAREVIVLEASSDATELQRRRAAAHIGDCDACRRFAADEPVSLAPLRTSLPLRDADFAAIRARVLSRIAQAEEPRGLMLPLRFALALTIVALFGLGVLLSIRRSDDPKHDAPTAAAATNPKPAPTPTPPAIATQVERTLPVKVPQTARAARHLRHTGRSTPPATVRQTTNPELRIQIQTPDPDVRIIWIVNPTPPQFTFPKEES